MPMHKHYITSNLYLENGIENREDGTVFLQREIAIRFVQDRFCNGLGRLFGPGGKTIKQLRQRSHCTIKVDTDNSTKDFPGKVTISIKDVMEVARRRVAFAVAEVLSILDENDVRNVNLSEFQLFNPSESDPDFVWHPASFKTESLKILPGGGIDRASLAEGAVQRTANSMTEEMIQKYLRPVFPALPSALSPSPATVFIPQLQRALPAPDTAFMSQIPSASMPLSAFSSAPRKPAYFTLPIRPCGIGAPPRLQFPGNLSAFPGSFTGTSAPLPHWAAHVRPQCVCYCGVCRAAGLN